MDSKLPVDSNIGEYLVPSSDPNVVGTYDSRGRHHSTPGNDFSFCVPFSS